MKVHRERSIRRPVVTVDGKGLVSHAGVGLLSEMADRSGLPAATQGRWTGGCGRPASSPPPPSRTSTSRTTRRSLPPTSATWRPWASSTPASPSSCTAPPGSASPTSPRPSATPPAGAVTTWCSRRRPGCSPTWPAVTPIAAGNPACAAGPARRCSSATTSPCAGRLRPDRGPGWTGAGSGRSLDRAEAPVQPSIELEALKPLRSAIAPVV